MQKSGIEAQCEENESFNLQPQTITTLEGKEVKQALTEYTKEQHIKYLGNWC